MIGGKQSVPNACGDSQPKKLRLLQDISAEQRGGPGHKAEIAVVTAAGVGAAAGETGFGAPERTHAPHFAAALRTMINVFAFHASRRGKWKGVAAFFVRQPEVTAGLAPFGSVRVYHAPRVAGVGHQVGEFMEKSAGQFLREGKQAGIKQDDRAIESGQTGRGAQAGVPAQGDSGGQSRQLESIGPSACFDLHVPQHLGRMEGAGLEGAGVWSRVHAQ